MKKELEKTALLRNSDGSIYHLNLLPGDLAQTIILVGDPDRVAKVSQHFDSIDIRKQKREFVTHTGTLNNQRLSVISTGIGTDNIDIVINECDALHNVDFDKNTIKSTITTLRFLRLGTGGGLQDISVGDLVISSFAIGIDNLMSFYIQRYNDQEQQLLKEIRSHFNAYSAFNHAYVAAADSAWLSRFSQQGHIGITLTCPGFYGAQYRTLRAPLISDNILKTANSFNGSQGVIVNVEMETVGIYALAKLLGHQACSVSVVLDNPMTESVSENMSLIVERMIKSIISLL